MESNNDRNTNGVFSLSLLAGAAVQSNEQALLRSNEKAKKYGLTLSPAQAAAIALTQSAALQRTGRLEFGVGIPGRLAEAFCDSPWISQEDYEQLLHEVTGLFYEFKNETMDIVSDEELIGFMQEAFNGFCKGSLELLAGRALPMLAEHVRSGQPFESFIYRAEQYELT